MTPQDLTSLAGKKILLGVSGSIAIVKSLDVISRLQKAGAAVRVVMTEDAKEMIRPVTYEAITGHPVYNAMWDTETSHEMEHLSWSKWGDLLLVVPASANTIAGIAHGFSSNALTSTALAFERQIVLCPAMNPAMYHAKATQANVDLLKSRGVLFLGPTSGDLACGDVGEGRLIEPEEIVSAVARYFSGGSASGEQKPSNEKAPDKNSPWSGKKVVITTGPTREPIDAVRYLTNASSGKMGYALATAAANLGAEVFVVAGPTTAPPPDQANIKIVPVTTACEMHDAVMNVIKVCQAAFFTAAVADFRPANPSAQKMKKSDMGENKIDLVPNPDIAAEVGKLNLPNQLRVGFAAETHDVEKFARQKITKKNLHAIIANDVSQSDRGFGRDENLVKLIMANDDAPVWESQLVSKRQLAEQIMEQLETLLTTTVAG
jgi:phosphopantothenoylcysteine decarboxylase/phosphopantothenate--cysteine ligase